MGQPFTLNSTLETRAPVGWMGTPLDSKGRFRNLNHPFWPEFSKLLRWQTQPNPQKKEKRALWIPEVLADGEFRERQDDCLVWLGHSTFFFRLGGVGFLTDPVMGPASVVKRHVAFPYGPEIAREADYLLLSHDHRDHCDAPSLKAVFRQNPNLKLLTGLHMAPLLKSILPGISIQEAGWYQAYGQTPGFRIWFVPSRHWSRRGLTDTNQRLWGGFVVEAPHFSLYFMGDSGYDTHFNQIGNLFPHIRLAVMGIGAYSPEWFMHPSHMKPEDSWKAFAETGAEHFVPMHYGTFDLADEPLGEPLVRLKAIADSDRISTPLIGQTLWL